MIIQGGTYKGLNFADSGVKLGDPYFNNTTLLLNNFNTSGNNSAFLVTPPGGVGSYVGSFNGSSQYLSVPNSAGNFGANSFTVELWVYFTSNTGGYKPIIENTGTADYQGWVLVCESNNTLSAYASNSGSAWNYNITTSYIPRTNTWTHIAYVRNGSTLTLYANGTAIGSASISTNSIHSPSNALLIGYYPYFPGGARYLNGYISNVRLVNGTAVYTADFTPPTTNLLPIAGTSLLTCRDSTFIDRSQNNLAITNNGTATIVNPNSFPAITSNGNTTQGSFSPFGDTWSNYFDGSGDNLIAPSNAAFGMGTGDFTVEAFVYFNASQTSVHITDSSTSGACFLKTTATTVGIGRSKIAEDTMFAYSFARNNWYHIAFSRSGSTVYGFVNGIQIGSAINTINYATGDCYIGSDAVSGQALNGYISNLRIVKGTAVYTANFTTPSSPLTAITNTSLLTCQSNRFIDNSSNNFTITRNGDVSVQRFSPFSQNAPYSSSVISGSAYLDGSGDYLSIADNVALEVGSGDFTLECWFYWTGTGSPFILSKSASSSYSPYVIGVMGSTGNLGFIASISGTTWNITITPAGTLEKNSWVHAAAVRNGNTFTLYKNGKSIGTTTSSSALWDNTDPFQVGFGGAFAGYVSNARLVKGTAVYTADFTPPTAPLTAITNTSLLLNYTNGGIIDNAMMNDLETVGTAQVSTGTVKYGTGSMVFPNASGGSNYITAPTNALYQLGTGNFTVEFWMNSVDTTSRYVFMLGTDWATANTLCLLQYLGQFALSCGTVNVISLGTQATNTWMHIAIVRSGSTVTLYLNGTSIGSITSSENLNIGQLRLGQQGAAAYWSGYYGFIDDFRITKGYARYTANFTPPQTSLPNFGAPKTPSVNYLIVAGGGGGGYSGTSFHGGGGGGAGGFRTGSLSVTANTSYTITVGSGGAGSSSYTNGANGTNSQFGSIWSTGGGGGGYGQIGVNTQGSGGGSGGGSVRGSGPSQGNIGGYTPSEGNAGGAGSSYKVGAVGDWGAAGGGGAISVGQDGMPYNIYRSGMGGNGAISMITSSPIIYAGGGGGGGCSYNVPTPGAGGAGGGGSGGSSSVGGNGATNLGAGGGGGYTNYAGGSGGSGVVIVAYPLSYAQAVSTTGSPTYSVVAGNHVYKFTGSGTITF